MPNITDPKFKWTPSARTDIRATFRRHGFVGPEEQRRQLAEERAGKDREQLTAAINYGEGHVVFL